MTCAALIDRLCRPTSGSSVNGRGENGAAAQPSGRKLLHPVRRDRRRRFHGVGTRRQSWCRCNCCWYSRSQSLLVDSADAARSRRPSRSRKLRIDPPIPGPTILPRSCSRHEAVVAAVPGDVPAATQDARSGGAPRPGTDGRARQVAAQRTAMHRVCGNGLDGKRVGSQNLARRPSRSRAVPCPAPGTQPARWTVVVVEPVGCVEYSGVVLTRADRSCR